MLPIGCLQLADADNPYLVVTLGRRQATSFMQVKNPEFEGQTKTRLGNPEVRKIVDGIVTSVSLPTLLLDPSMCS